MAPRTRLINNRRGSPRALYQRDHFPSPLHSVHTHSSVLFHSTSTSFCFVLFFVCCPIGSGCKPREDLAFFILFRVVRCVMMCTWLCVCAFFFLCHLIRLHSCFTRYSSALVLGARPVTTEPVFWTCELLRKQQQQQQQQHTRVPKTIPGTW